MFFQIFILSKSTKQLVHIIALELQCSQAEKYLAFLRGSFYFFCRLFFGMRKTLCFVLLCFCVVGEASLPVYVYIDGYAGGNWTGGLDVLASLLLNNEHNFFLYGQARFGTTENNWEDNTWSGSLGLGYRQSYQNRTFGAYLLADYNKTISDHSLFDLSPGFESLGEKWDFRLNGYIPLGSTSWQSTYWASDLGDYTYYKPTGHEVYDAQYTYNEEASYGGDAEIGYKLFTVKHMPCKIYADGYWFYVEDNDNIAGLGGRLTFQPTNYLTLEAKYSYDNYQENVFLVGFRIYLNGFKDGLLKPYHVEDEAYNRLFDQIQRNTATWSLGNSIPVVGGLGAQPKNTPDNPDVIPDDLKDDNVWYFDGSSMAGTNTQDGTYENPYSADKFTQETVDSINQYSVENDYTHADFYLTAGTYNNLTYNNSDGIIDLAPYDSIYGKTDDYRNPATNDKPLLIGGLELTGFNTVDSIQLQNLSSGAIASGITIDNGATDVVLSNDEIGANETIGSYRTGVTMDNAQVLITGSVVYAYVYGTAKSDGDILAMGINMTNGGSLAVDNSKISSSAEETGGAKNYSGISYGIRADGQAEVINIGYSEIYAYGSGGYNNSGNGIGIYLGKLHDSSTTTTVSGNVVNVNHSNVEGVGYGKNNDSGEGYGILLGGDYAYETYSVPQSLIVSSNTVLVTNSSVTGKGYAQTPSSGLNDNNTGNGYGVVFGEEEASLPGSLLKVDGNLLTANDSEIKGLGFDRTSLPADCASYGILFGYNELVYSGQLITTYNRVNVTKSYIEAHTEDSSGTSAGYAFGILIGDGIQRSSASTPSTVENSYNTVNITNGVTVEASGSTSVYGVFIGSPRIANNIYDTHDNSVAVTAASELLSNSFFIVSASGSTYGIWMDTGSGSLEIDSNEIFASNKQAGAAIHNPDGTIVVW